MSTGVCFDTRTIYLGDIEEGAGQRFLMQLHLLLAASAEPVNVLMNSHGGRWNDALAIYDAIGASDAPTNLLVMGSCMSAAAVIAQAFDHRVISPNTAVMVHNGSWDGGADNIVNAELWATWLKQERKRMYAILGSRSHKDAKWWARKCGVGDFIFTADRAVELGLFDEVIGNG